MEREELGHWLRLTLTPGVGNATARKLLAAFGLPGAVFNQSAAALRQVVGETLSNNLRTEPTELAELLDITWNWLQTSELGCAQRHIVVLGDVDYPTSLLNIEDPPLLLYLLGAAKFIQNTQSTQVIHAQTAPISIASELTNCLINSIAIVGSRNPTPQGAANARHFSKTQPHPGGLGTRHFGG